MWGNSLKCAGLKLTPSAPDGVEYVCPITYSQSEKQINKTQTIVLTYCTICLAYPLSFYYDSLHTDQIYDG